jgi:bacillithiol system protein YtxJ
VQFNILNQMNQLEAIDHKSQSKYQVIFKHSTRCSVSHFANKNLLQEMKSIDENAFDIYYLDLIAFRNLSNNISIRYQVKHESPQILVIKDGKCIYHASHAEVTLDIDELAIPIG